MWKTFLDGGSGDEGRSASAARSGIDAGQFKLLAEFFPIGKKLRYIPDFKQEIVLDTLIVAYCVDGEFVYSGEAIKFTPDGDPSAVVVGERGRQVPVGEIKRLQLLVPDTSSQEMRLDYVRRAMIGRGRQFHKGNSISLIAKGGARGVATMDTEVVKQVVLKDGPYAHTNMVLLAPELDTLAVTDQRGRARTKICVPVTLAVADSRLRGPCTIVDVSDAAVRIRVRDGDTMPQIGAGTEVTLELDLGESERRYTIKGTVIRRSAETCAVRLDAFDNDGRFVGLGPLDRLELKAALLNYVK